MNALAAFVWEDCLLCLSPRCWPVLLLPEPQPRADDEPGNPTNDASNTAPASSPTPAPGGMQHILRSAAVAAASAAIVFTSAAALCCCVSPGGVDVIVVVFEEAAAAAAAAPASLAAPGYGAFGIYKCVGNEFAALPQTTFPVCLYIMIPSLPFHSIPLDPLRCNSNSLSTAFSHFSGVGEKLVNLPADAPRKGIALIFVLLFLMIY